MRHRNETNKLPSKTVLPSRLLQTKLTPPGGGKRLVPRTRLIDWLQSAEHARLVMLRAPAGFGKTSLMVQWSSILRDQAVPTAWLTLDEDDNDLVRFLTYLIAAIKKCLPEFDRNEPEQESIGIGYNPSGVLSYLIDLISIFEGPFTVFLDDFGVIKNPEALELIRQFLQQLPPGKKLVIALRHEPELSLGKLRAQGELVEIDLEGLRFTLEETMEYIHQAQGLELDDKEVTQLHNSTEGWAAGIQLSTLTSVWRDKPGIPGKRSAAFENISLYLVEDVLTRQPAEVQSFLLQTSFLPRLCGPLCNAITGQTDGEMMLDYLEKQNLFLTPLDEDRHWYRYHSLFAKFLQHQLARKSKEVMPTLYRAAYVWYAEAGEYLEAARFAMLIEEPDLAAEQVEICAYDLPKSGLVATIAEWVERLPQEIIDRHLELQLHYAYTQIHIERPQKAHAVLDRMMDNVRILQNESFNLDIWIARSFALMCQEKMTEFEQVILAGLSEYFTRKHHPDTRFVPVLMNLAGMLFLTHGEHEKALNIIWEGARLIGDEKDEVRIYNKYYEGRIYLSQGKLYETLLLTRSILDCKEYGLCLYAAGGTAHAVLEAEVLYEKNDLVGSNKLLTSYYDMLSTSVVLEAMIAGFRTLARICLARGDRGGATRYITELERLGVQKGIPRASASARLERIRIALLYGELEPALQIARDHDDRSIWLQYEKYCLLGNDPETPEIGRLRLLIGRGMVKEALESLKRELKSAEAKGYFRQILLLRILISKAYHEVGEKRLAMDHLKTALSSAQTEGFIRCFIDEGESIAGMLHEIHQVAFSDEKNDGGSSISVKYLNQIQSARGITVPPPYDVAPNRESTLLETLTIREKDILVKLAMGYSGNELASHLFVSVNTVKYHLRNIYSKLGTNNRVQTVALARRLGLIS